MQKRGARWLVGGVVLGAVGAGTLLLIPREKLLLTKAHKIALTSEQLGYERSAWRGAQEQLLLRRMDNTNHFGVFTRDIGTGKETSLEPFNTTSAALLKAQNPRFGLPRFGGAQRRFMSQFMPPPVHAFSPDGRWLLWGDKSSCRAIPLEQIANVSSQQSFSWKLTTSKNRFGSSIQWLHDSRHWIELDYDAQFYLHGVTLHSLDAPDANRPKAFASRGSRWPLGITPDDHLLSYEPNIPPPSPALIYYDTPLNAPQPVSRKITIPLPSGTTIHTVLLSPDGTHLLWSLRTEMRLPGPPWMQKVCARLGMKPRMLRGLWISRRDGSDLREIGHITEKLPNLRAMPRFAVTAQIQQSLAQFLSRDLYEIQWLPNNKQVLFAIGNDVYTVDVE